MSNDTIIEAMRAAILAKASDGWSGDACAVDPEDAAQAAYNALIEGGFVVVPREPTVDMMSDGAIATNRPVGVSDIYDIWDSMVSTFLEGLEGVRGSSRIGGETCAASVASDLTGPQSGGVEHWVTLPDNFPGRTMTEQERAEYDQRFRNVAPSDIGPNAQRVLDGLNDALEGRVVLHQPKSAAPEFEVMTEGADGWSDWIHPLPGYRMKCCDCGLVHEMEFEIAASNGDGQGFNEGEGDDGVIVFRARREPTRTPPNAGSPGPGTPSNPSNPTKEKA
jgi:hypothetical protein